MRCSGAWTDGDQRALDRLTPIVYDGLHRLAHYHLQRERVGHSLQTTALVNEAYMRLVDYKRMQWQNRRSCPTGSMRSGPTCAFSARGRTLNHPDIGHVYGLEQSDGERALVMAG